MDIENFKDFSIDLTEAIQQAAEETAKELARDIAAGAPVADHGSNIGAYKSGWTSRPEPDGATVYNNSIHVSLSSLIEYGHRGNRNNHHHYIPPHPHIRPAYESAKDAYRQKLIDLINDATRNM